MHKIGSLTLTVGASIVAVTGGIFLVYANDKSQVVGKVATEAADAGSVRIPDRPDWNWDVRRSCRRTASRATARACRRLACASTLTKPPTTLS